MATRLRLLLGLGLAASLAACAAPRPASAPAPLPAPPPAAAAPSPTFAQQGVASWYGKSHHGRRTANGETYDMNAMTAAHRTLPFGAVVRVTRLDDGRSVTVRINDRGPYARGRIIDLSAEAAESIGMTEQGVARVKVEQFAADQRAGGE
ncbi:MAG: septal ring lytic transglycosylase RlpA family protein [Alphaproteobacteria bacterium]